MKDRTIQGLLRVLDNSFETQVKNIHYHFSASLSLGDYSRDLPNILIKSSLIYEEYQIIRKLLLKRTKQYKSFRIVDFGCGVGNVLQILKEIIKSDRTVFKFLKYTNVIGIEKYSPYATNCINNLDGNSEVHCLNMRNSKELNETMEDILNKPNVDLNIWYCNRPYRDMEEEAELEKYLLEMAPIGTFLINPMGFSAEPIKGIKVINKHIYEKIRSVEYYN